jgi:hypothetical protein
MILSDNQILEVLDFLPVEQFYALTLMNEELRNRYGPVLGLPGYEETEPHFFINALDTKKMELANINSSSSTLVSAFKNSATAHGIDKYHRSLKHVEMQLVRKHASHLEYVFLFWNRSFESILKLKDSIIPMPRLKCSNLEFGSKKIEIRVSASKQTNKNELYKDNELKLYTSLYVAPEWYCSDTIIHYDNIEEVEGINEMPMELIVPRLLRAYSCFNERVDYLKKMYLSGNIGPWVGIERKSFTTLFYRCDVQQWKQFLQLLINQTKWLVSGNDLRGLFGYKMEWNHPRLWLQKNRKQTIKKLDVMKSLHVLNHGDISRDVHLEQWNKNFFVKDYLLHRSWFRIPHIQEILTDSIKYRTSRKKAKSLILFMVHSIRTHGWNQMPNKLANKRVILPGAFASMAHVMKCNMHLVLKEVQDTLHTLTLDDWKQFLLVACDRECTHLLELCFEDEKRVRSLETEIHYRVDKRTNIPIAHSLSQLLNLNSNLFVAAVKQKRISDSVIRSSESLSHFVRRRRKKIGNDVWKGIFNNIETKNETTQDGKPIFVESTLGV